MAELESGVSAILDDLIDQRLAAKGRGHTMREPLRMGALSGDDMARLGSIEATMPVYYCGRQWAVTGHGLEELPIRGIDRKPYYRIARNDIARAAPSEWADHMAKKVWVDKIDFAEAMKVALEVYCPSGEPKITDLNEWIAEKTRKRFGVDDGSGD